MWILWALISALCAAVRRTNEKQLTNKLNFFTIGFIVQLMSLPIITVALLLHGVFLNPFRLGFRFWGPLIGTVVGFYPLNVFLYLQAVKHSEISKVLPIQSLWPVFSLIPAWLTLGETPSPVACLGICVTILGVYALGLNGKALHHPLQPFRQEKGSRYMLFAVLLVTIAGVLDKIAIKASDAVYYSFASTIGAVTVLACVLYAMKINELSRLRESAKGLGILGTLQGLSYTTYLLALSLGPIAYVSSIRSSNVLLGSILGFVILKEKLTTAKVLSFVFIAAGSVLLAVGS